MHIMPPKRVRMWRPEQECAFEQLHKLLCNPTVLKLPGFQKHFIVDTDTSINAMGALLLQEYDDGLHFIMFHSSK